MDKTLSKVDQLQKEQGFSFSEVNEALVKENKEKMKTQHGCIVLHKMIYKEPRSAISVEQYVKWKFPPGKGVEKMWQKLG